MSVMKHTVYVVSLISLMGAPKASGQSLLGTGFAYQGRLDFKGTPAEGAYDLRFSLWEALIGGDNVGPTVCLDEVQVVDGLFTVELDFGNVFGEKARFLAIEVAEGGSPGSCGSGGFNLLAPRQAILATPVAMSVMGVDGHSLNAADGSPQDVVFVDGAGEAGIGTSAPDGKLHVRQTGLAAGARVEIVNGSSTAPALLVTNAGIGPVARFEGPIDLVSGADTTTVGQASLQVPADFAAAFGGDLNTQVGSDWLATVDRSFNLDAGTTVNLESTTSTTISAGTQLALSASGSFSVASPVFVVQTSGRTGINTSPGSFHLAVAGLTANANGSWNVLSDARLKTNVRPLTGVLARLMALHGVRFAYKSGAGPLAAGGERTGFIAQEVREVFPEWVSETDEGYLTVGPSGFEAMTVEALRELRAEKDAQIVALVSDNNDLRATLETLADRLEDLESRMASTSER